MSSTASPIDRETSNLPTHQVLALAIYLITHKFTILSVSSTNRADMGKQFRANVTWGSLRQRSNVVARNLVARKHIVEMVYECCWQHFALTLNSVNN